MCTNADYPHVGWLRSQEGQKHNNPFYDSKYTLLPFRLNRTGFGKAAIELLKETHDAFKSQAMNDSFQQALLKRANVRFGLLIEFDEEYENPVIPKNGSKE
jgi:hypothetical protein